MSRMRIDATCVLQAHARMYLEVHARVYLLRSVFIVYFQWRCLPV